MGLLRSPKMSAAQLPVSSLGPAIAAGVSAPGIPPRVYHSNQVADELAAETNLLESRRTLYSELRQAEANEQTTTEKRIADEHTTNCRLAEEHDQARRAHEADAIAHRASEEHQIHSAESRGCTDRAEAANAALKHAQEIYQQAQAAREAEVKAAETTANEARNAEANFAQALSIEERALAERSSVEQNLHNLDTQFHTHVTAGYGAAPAGYGAPQGYGY